jgi:hypothetical protein
MAAGCTKSSGIQFLPFINQVQVSFVRKNEQYFLQNNFAVFLYHYVLYWNS